jgi:sugar phosphate permease
MGFMGIYFIIAWIPSLFVGSGWTMSEGIYALTVFNLGAIFGTTSIGLITTRYTMKWPIGLFFAATAILMVYLTMTKPTELMMLYVMIFVIGLFLNGAFSAMYAVAARLYRSAIRSTGIGWCAGLGRTGAIVAPILAGYLVAQSFDMYSLFAVFAVPVILAALLIITIKV